jgi:succinoglycan biosynthesis protein ExoM
MAIGTPFAIQLGEQEMPCLPVPDKKSILGYCIATHSTEHRYHISSCDSQRGCLTEIFDAPARLNPATGPDAIDAVTIAICTFRRPAIVEALDSLARLRLRDIRFDVIVVDNDDVDTARDVVQTSAARLSLNLRYLHVPGSNISIARNACLEACQKDWLAFIDDDETATSDWLQNLVDGARQQPGIAAAFGPMQAIYGEDTPDWLKRGDFHSTAIVYVDGEIRTGYTTNTLIHLRHPAVIGKRFDLALGKSGGEDTDFFDRVYIDGGRFANVPTAVVEEVLTPDRQSLTWFMRRRFRSGQTHARLLARRCSGIARLRQATIAAGKAAICLLMLVVSCFDSVAWRRWLLRGVLHLGVVARLSGRAEQALYGATSTSDQDMTAGRI